MADVKVGVRIWDAAASESVPTGLEAQVCPQQPTGDTEFGRR